MNFNQINEDFAAFALVANALLIALVVAYVATRFSDKGRAKWIQFRSSFGRSAIPCAWIVGIVCTGGSLYFQFGEGLIPCDLCWFQRIAMYPQVIILGVATYLQDRYYIKRYSIPMVAIGAVISIIHINLTNIMSFLHIASFPGCSFVAPCSVQPFTIWGFITIPYMALSGFLLIMILLIISSDGADEQEDETHE